MERCIRLHVVFCLSMLMGAVLSARVADAQLIDPNNQCYYPPGSTVCQPLPPSGQQQQQLQPQPQPQPPRPTGNACEANCQGQQQECMNRCTAQNDWYRCFAYCGDVRTTCMRQCPLRF
jgi:hypothetical protein